RTLMENGSLLRSAMPSSASLLSRKMRNSPPLARRVDSAPKLLLVGLVAIGDLQSRVIPAVSPKPAGPITRPLKFILSSLSCQGDLDRRRGSGAGWTIYSAPGGREEGEGGSV